MKIGITYNLKEEISPAAVIDDEFTEEFDTTSTIDALCNVFAKNGYDIARLGSGIEIIEKIKKEPVDFVFNIAEGLSGRNRESHLPSILEMLNIPYSGSDPLTLGLALDKIAAKKIAFVAGIPTPSYKVVTKIDDLDYITNQLEFPLIAKPAWEGSSKGIYDSSKVFNKNELKRNINLLFKKFPGQPLLVEEYIAGREITVGVLGNESVHVLGLMEIGNKICPGEDFFYSLQTKRDWQRRVDYAAPPNIGRLLEKHIRHYAILAFREFGCRDIARIDFRISQHDKIYMLEINPLPGLSPEYADLVIMSQKLGITYEELVLSILRHALSRYEVFKKDSRILGEKSKL